MDRDDEWRWVPNTEVRDLVRSFAARGIARIELLGEHHGRLTRAGLFRPGRRLPRILSGDEARRLLDALSRAVMGAPYRTGLRSSDIVTFVLEDSGRDEITYRDELLRPFFGPEVHDLLRSLR